MKTEAAKLIFDIQEAITDIRKFTQGMDFDGYLQDDKTRAAVERKFEIVGEACMRLRDRAPDVFEEIPSAAQIIGFRNRLIHGYDHVESVRYRPSDQFCDLISGRTAILTFSTDSLRPKNHRYAQYSCPRLRSCGLQHPLGCRHPGTRLSSPPRRGHLARRWVGGLKLNFLPEVYYEKTGDIESAKAAYEQGARAATDTSYARERLRELGKVSGER